MEAKKHRLWEYIRSITADFLDVPFPFPGMRGYKHLIFIHPKQTKDSMIIRKVSTLLVCCGPWFFSRNTQWANEVAFGHFATAFY